MTTDTERGLGICLFLMGFVYVGSTYSSAVSGTMPPTEDTGPLLEFGLFLWIVMVVFAPILAVAWLGIQWLMAPDIHFSGGEIPPGRAFPIG